MKKMSGIALALASLMATAAFAETATQSTTTAPAKKVVTKKKISKKNSKSAASAGVRNDALVASASSATSSATTGISMPGLTAGTSAAQGAAVGTPKKAWTDNVRLAFGLEYYGPSVTDPLSGRQPGLDPTSSNHTYSQGNGAVELLEHVSVGYAFNDNLSFTLDPYFETIGDGLNDDGTKDTSASGSSFRYREDFSYFALRVKRIVKTKKFTYSGNFRFTPGFGERNHQRPLYFRHDMNLVYNVTSRFNISMYNTIRYYDRTASYYDATKTDSATGQQILANPTGFDLRATLGPTLEYQISDPVGSYLSYVADVRRNHNTGSIYDAAPDTAPYIELGMGWDITKKINLNPYVDAYTNTPNIEAWQLGANLMVTIL